ncbi:DNA-3-methyladenine glycosylase [Spirochaetia bacterium]|nr:DNA-3-methyladenine glycosylase [Spirochaetia bacterium]
MEIKRCPWCLGNDVYVQYHDEEWGVPVKDSRKLFEHLILDGAQAGLSWLTILKRRDGYRAAFDNFDPEKMARWTDKKIERLMGDERIIRNRLKIKSAVTNAKIFLQMEESGNKNFSGWLWDWTGGAPIINKFTNMDELPAATPLSTRISAELKKLGWTFVGPTIVYAFMQASGLVNDHLVDCFRYKEVKAN